MKRADLIKLHDELSLAARDLMEAKNHDYSGGADDTEPFLNFTRVEKLGITTTEKGMLVRMTDKLSRLITLVDGNQVKVKDETLKDTVIDVINYSILLYAYVSKR